MLIINLWNITLVVIDLIIKIEFNKPYLFGTLFIDMQKYNKWVITRDWNLNRILMNE